MWRGVVRRSNCGFGGAAGRGKGGGGGAGLSCKRDGVALILNDWKDWRNMYTTKLTRTETI